MNHYELKTHDFRTFLKFGNKAFRRKINRSVKFERECDSNNLNIT